MEGEEAVQSELGVEVNEPVMKEGCVRGPAGFEKRGDGSRPTNFLVKRWIAGFSSEVAVLITCQVQLSGAWGIWRGLLLAPPSTRGFRPWGLSEGRASLIFSLRTEHLEHERPPSTHDQKRTESAHGSG
jgi:hypothetical protein